MKKILFTAIITSSFLAACSQNKVPAHPEQVFGQPTAKTLSIAQVKQQADDALVMFSGKIVRQVDNDEYIVADSTGEIQVEIDSHIWRGLNVKASETIRIHGEVDKEAFSTKVDARHVEKVQ